MTDDRLSVLESQMTDLRIAVASDRAATSAAIDHLTEAVRDLTKGVQEFRDTMNKGRGAVWLFGVMAAAIGGIISWATTLLFR